MAKPMRISQRMEGHMIPLTSGFRMKGPPVFTNLSDGVDMFILHDNGFVKLFLTEFSPSFRAGAHTGVGIRILILSG